MLYGSTQLGGSNGFGTIYEFDTNSAAVNILHSFDSYVGEGSGPTGNLIQLSNGNIYGTTVTGGALGGGSVFELTPFGALNTLHSFAYQDEVEGWSPRGGITRGAGTALYGTTMWGGGIWPKFEGTIFSVDGY
jgi:uncharacterized repeat protein (TIGR03803 family)